MTKAGARGFLQACFAMAALLLFAAAGLRAETLDHLYEKAKLDKALVFYAGGPAAPHENRAKEFMQKYPAIAVSVMGGFSNVLNEQIEKQMADRKLDRLSLATMVALLCFFLRLLASPFKSNSRLEAENAVVDIATAEALR
jgi:hypothetical protein